MKTFLRQVALLLLAAWPCTLSYGQQIHVIDTRVTLLGDGSAAVVQVWDVDVESGTEWYIPFFPLRDGMELTDFGVSEAGTPFASEGTSWRTRRSIEEKAGRCGILDKGSDGFELCWGIGSLGPHRWEVSYTLKGLVKSLQDYDAFNHQFVNDEQPTEPEQVTLTIENGTGGPVWTYDNTRIWGFGFDGTIDLVDGRIVARSEGRFPSNASMIVMARFEKGLFQPVISLDKPFSSMEKKAKKGSSYKRFDPVLLLFALGFILFFGGLLVGGIWVLVARLCGFVWKKSFFGKRKITEWFRDAPFGGDIFSSYYVLDKGRRFSGHSPQTNIVGAFFLKWILDGKVRVQTDERNKKKTSLVMGEVPPEFDTDEEAALFRMALEAAGENRILEPSEFENWSKKHYAQMANWPGKVSSRGLANLIGKKLAKGLKGMTADGQREAVHVVEFKNFLSDFTLVDQREAAEVGLWKEYLVYAQLYGIADKVMAQLKKLFPVQFDAYARQAGMDPYVLNTTVRRMNTMSRTSFQNASASQAAAQAAQAARAAGGRGGRTSFGGGGGFSGGGHGGGSR